MKETRCGQSRESCRAGQRGACWRGRPRSLPVFLWGPTAVDWDSALTRSRESSQQYARHLRVIALGACVTRVSCLAGEAPSKVPGHALLAAFLQHDSHASDCSIAFTEPPAEISNRGAEVRTAALRTANYEVVTGAVANWFSNETIRIIKLKLNNEDLDIQELDFSDERLAAAGVWEHSTRAFTEIKGPRARQHSGPRSCRIIHLSHHHRTVAGQRQPSASLSILPRPARFASWCSGKKSRSV